MRNLLVTAVTALALAVPAQAQSGVHIGSALSCHGHGKHHKCCWYGPKGHRHCSHR